mgnify:FL=1
MLQVDVYGRQRVVQVLCMHDLPLKGQQMVNKFRCHAEYYEHC